MKPREFGSTKLGVERLEDRSNPTATLTTSIRDAFGQTGITSPWQVSTQLEGGAQTPLSNYRVDLYENQHPELRGVDRPEVLTTTPQLNVGITSDPNRNWGMGFMTISKSLWQAGVGGTLVWNTGYGDNNGQAIVMQANLANPGPFSFFPPQDGETKTGSLTLVTTQGQSIDLGQTRCQGGALQWVSNPANKPIPALAYSQSTRLPSDLLVGLNTASSTVTTPLNVQWDAQSVLARPGKNEPVTFSWTSPRSGLLTTRAVLKDMEPLAGDGVTYTLTHTQKKTYPRGFVGPKEGPTVTTVYTGLLQNGGMESPSFGGTERLVNSGDIFTLTISPKGTANVATENIGDATKIDWSIRVEDEPARLQRTSADKIETEAVIPNVEVWGTGSQLKIRYNNIPDMGVDVRMGTEVNVHLNQGSGTQTINLNGTFVGNPQSQGSLWIERSDTHAPITKTFSVDMGGGYGQSLRALTLPQGPIPLLALAESRVLITKATDIQAAMRGELQSLLDGRPSIRESLSITERDTVPLADSTSSRATLAQLGGTSMVTAWIGGANTQSSLATASSAMWLQEYARLQALRTNPSGLLVQQANLPNALWMDAPNQPTYARSISIPGMGNVMITADDGTQYPSTGLTGYSHYMGVQNNVLGSSDYGSTVNGVANVANFGKRWLRFTLPSTMYVRSISVSHLGGTHDGSITIRLANGTERDIPLDGSGEIIVDDVISRFTLNPGARSAFGISGISTGTIPSAAITAPATIQKLSGAAASIDLSQSQTLVSRVSGKLMSERPDDVFTVRAMRGSTVVQSIDTGPDGSFVFTEQQGITSLVVTHTKTNAPFCMGDLMAEGERGSVPLNMPSNTTKTSGELSNATKPEFESGAPWNFQALVQQYGVNTQEHPTATNGATILRGAGNNPSKYVIHKALSSGSAEILQVLAFTEQGMIEVPARLYTRLADNAIATFPGAPQNLVLRIRFTGVLNTAGAVDFGDTFASIAPPENFSPKANILALTPQPVSVPGFGNPILQINQGANAQLVPGGSVGMMAHIVNEGLTGGQVTVKVYCGYFGDERDALQGTFTTNMNGSEVRSLSVTVGAPQGPTGARPMITIVCQTPNGVTRAGWTAPIEHSRSEIRVVDPITGQLKTIVLQPSAEDALAIARTQNKNLVAAQMRGDANIAMYKNSSATAWNDYHDAVARDVATMLASLQKPEMLAAAGVLLPTQEKLFGMGSGTLRGAHAGPLLAKADTSDGSYASAISSLVGEQKEQLLTELNWNSLRYQEVSSWYTSRSAIRGLEGIPVREETAQGRLFLALLQGTQNELLSSNLPLKLFLFSWCLRIGVTDSTDITLNGLNASTLSKALQGIDPSTGALMVVPANTSSDRQRVLCLKKLFEIGQMGNIFNNSETGPLPPISELTTNKYIGSVPRAAPLDVYRSFNAGNLLKDDYIICRFNGPDTFNAPYNRLKVCLADMNGNIIPGTNGEALSVKYLGNLSFSIPLSEITACMTNGHIEDAGRNYHKNPTTGSMSNTFRLVLRSYQSSTSGTPGYSILSNHQFQVEIPSTVSFDPKEVLGSLAYNALKDPADITRITSALNFGEIKDSQNNVLTKNIDLVNWLVDNFLRFNSTESKKMDFIPSLREWVGSSAYGPLDSSDPNVGQCKFWIQQNVMLKGLGIGIPDNLNDYSWKNNQPESANVEKKLEKLPGSNETFQNLILNSREKIVAGDLIQMAAPNLNGLHTMVIGKIETDGIWVFDSNFVASNTPGYHKVLYTSLNQSTAFTIYRLK